ncbi:hypothetical protein BSPWISOX_1809 [uncultured Gammaproteobacteria bacterium]|jgi:hypothetical protein|nr:hypothetical protein BSPWISOX_1809 [uncultured Gammaproteobacteria bacterium]VVM27226.1 hypothetical protein BSPWISOXPB_3090 [uncultured Gammaproteobacteria bacterium]
MSYAKVSIKRLTLYESIEQAMDHKIVQLSVKQLNLLVNEDHTLVLGVGEDYHVLSFTLIYPRIGKASINTVKINPLQDRTVFKTCGEYLVFKEKFEWNDCSEVVIKLLVINRKNKFELFLSNLLSLSFKSFATRVTKISNTVLAKAFDQPISEVVDTISGEQHTMELAGINTNVKTLLDKQVSTLALTLIATLSNISQFDINQIYFGDEEIKAI